VFIFCNTGLAAEFGIGRRSKTGTVGSYYTAWLSAGGKIREKIGRVVGWLPLAGSMCIAIGYAVIITYVLKAFVHSVSGTLMTVDTGQWFQSFSETNYSVVPLHIIVVAGTLLTLLLGASSIEKSNTVMMPLFFLVFVILAIRVALLPGAIEGYKFIVTIDWAHFADPMLWVWAMGQAFFSLSVTGSGMIVYGAYLDDKEDLVSAARYTGLFDTIASFVAMLVIIPACLPITSMWAAALGSFL
jgi:NSS family neurotransmitter:Na+ symporter